MLAKVAVEAAVYTIDKPYTYRIPSEWHACPGVRVSVPFGRSNRLSEGVVFLWKKGRKKALKV